MTTKLSPPTKDPVEKEMQRQVELTDGVNGIGEKDDLNPSAQHPLNIAENRASFSKNFKVKNPWRYLSYVIRDVFVVFALAAAAAYLNSWSFWPLYWAAQGTMFWAIFVLGHDCGNGIFSDYLILNSLVWHIFHSSVLVACHGWRISHRTHHLNYGSVENDKSWFPGRDAWVLLYYIWSLLRVLISLMLVPIRDPWSSLSSYLVSFNDNDTLQCPEVSADVQRLRVVELGNSVEGRGRDVQERVGEGYGECESGGEGRGEDGGGGVGGGGGGGDNGGGDGGGDGEGRDIIESGGGDMNRIRSTINKLIKMSIMVAVQTTAGSIGSRSCGQHSRIFLDCILVNDLAGYFCCMIAILLAHKKPRVAEILGWIGFAIVAFGFVLLTTMFFIESRVC